MVPPLVSKKSGPFNKTLSLGELKYTDAMLESLPSISTALSTLHGLLVHQMLCPLLHTHCSSWRLIVDKRPYRRDLPMRQRL